MNNFIKLITVIFVVLFSITTANGQLRPVAAEQKIKKEKGPKRFFFQIEPAISFPKDLGTTVLGTNLSMLTNILETPLTPDSKIKLLTRFRFTTGFWHFSGDFGESYYSPYDSTWYSYSWDYDFGWIPLEGGIDLGFPVDMTNDNSLLTKIIPYLGYQFGMGFTLYDDNSDVVEMIDSIRLGVDLGLGSKFTVGVSFIINGLIFDDVSYNQLGFGINMPM